MDITVWGHSDNDNKVVFSSFETGEQGNRYNLYLSNENASFCPPHNGLWKCMG